MPLIIRMLGPFELSPVSPRCSRKGGWLVALLALRAGREVDRAWLAGTLWPDTTESQSLYDLRRELSRMRRCLGKEAPRLRPVGARALTLDLAGAEVDLIEFDRAVERGDVERAVALYTGPFLEGCTEPWALEEREPRAQAHLAALEQVAAQALRRGDPSTAVRWLQRAVKADPLREGARRTLMRALAAAGSHGAATQTYRELRQLLERELATEPDPETRALYHQLRAAAQAPVAHSAPHTPSSAAVSSRGRLPRPLTPLVGRTLEVREIAARSQDTRLLTLTGTGGVGKSRLAVQVATERAPHFVDGAWFVELAPLADGALVVPAVASTFGLPEGPGRALLDAIAAHLRGQQALLVLDNCEHVLDAAGRVAEHLLRECADLQVLATSRQPLGVSGEVAWRVPSMVTSDAVALFQERAGQPEDPRTVSQICERLDGIPLAIELAAARTRVLTVTQIAERLDDRFRLLTGGSRTALRRAIARWRRPPSTGATSSSRRRSRRSCGGSRSSRAASRWRARRRSRGAMSSTRWRGWWTSRSSASTAATGCSRRSGSLRRRSSPSTGRRSRRGPAIWSRCCAWPRPRSRSSSAGPTRGAGSSGSTPISTTCAPRWTSARRTSATPRPRCDWRLRCTGSGSRAVICGRAAAGWPPLSGGGRQPRAPCARAPWRPPATSRCGSAITTRWPRRSRKSLRRAQALADDRLSAYALCGLGAAATLRGERGVAPPLLAEAVRLSRGTGDRMLLVFTLYWFGTALDAETDRGAARVALEEGLALARDLGNVQGIGHTLFRLGQVLESEGRAQAARDPIPREPARARPVHRPLGHRSGARRPRSPLGLHGRARARGLPARRGRSPVRADRGAGAASGGSRRSRPGEHRAPRARTERLRHRVGPTAARCASDQAVAYARSPKRRQGGPEVG